MGLSEINAKIQFEKDPKLQERFGTLENYLQFQKLQLKRESAWTFGKSVTDNIKNGVKDWVSGKEKARDDAEARYEAAMQASYAMDANYEKALSELQTKYRAYGDDTSKYNDALTAYNNLKTSKFDTDLEVKLARDHFNDADQFYGRISYMG